MAPRGSLRNYKESDSLFKTRKRERERFTSESHVPLWEHSSHFRLIGRDVPSVSVVSQLESQTEKEIARVGQTLQPHTANSSLYHASDVLQRGGPSVEPRHSLSKSPNPLILSKLLFQFQGDKPPQAAQHERPLPKTQLPPICPPIKCPSFHYHSMAPSSRSRSVVCSCWQMSFMTTWQSRWTSSQRCGFSGFSDCWRSCR